jgi:uncharacterized protein YegL
MKAIGLTPQPGKSKTELVVKQKRCKTNVVVVLDLSGSMNGSKLNEAKQELSKLGQLLEEDDSLSIITFADTVLSAMNRRFKWQPKHGQVKRNTQFDETDLKKIVDRLHASGQTALYDAVSLAIQQTQLAAESDLKEHPDAEAYNYQLLVITDGKDNASRTANAASVNRSLLHPGIWGSKCHFSSCFVAIGEKAAKALQPCTTGLKYSVTVSDIEAGFKRLTETVAQIKTQTVQKLTKVQYETRGS